MASDPMAPDPIIVAQQIKAFIKARGGGVSFVELAEYLGDAGKGDYSIGMEDWNIWFWFGMSKLFVDALELLRREIRPTATSVLVYLADGELPRLPIAKRKYRYKEPHWLPVVWDIRNEKKASKVVYL